MDKKMKSQRGVTLIELLAVLAIIGILAAIIIPTAVGSGEAGKEGQGKQDATGVDSAASDFFSAQDGAEFLTRETVDISAIAGAPTTGEQAISSRWPEKFITSNESTGIGVYELEVPTVGGDEAAQASTGVSPDEVDRTVSLELLDSDGIAITEDELLGGFTAIDFAALTAGNFLQADPAAVSTVSTVGSGGGYSASSYATFLWLFEKTSSTAGTDDSRRVAVFKLTSADVDETSSRVTLRYERIF